MKLKKNKNLRVCGLLKYQFSNIFIYLFINFSTYIAHLKAELNKFKIRLNDGSTHYYLPPQIE